MTLSGVLSARVACDLYLVKSNVRKQETKVQKKALTFVSLLLDLKLLCQVLLILPLYLRPNRAVIHKIARIADLLAVHVRLHEHVIFEIFVWRKLKDELEAGLGFARGKVLDTEVGDVLECASVAFGDQI
jgi:hypothetical protein